MTYTKLKENVKKYFPIQFGLCGFKVLPEKKLIEAYPFNFYIFPFSLDKSLYQTMHFEVIFTQNHSFSSQQSSFSYKTSLILI